MPGYSGTPLPKKLGLKDNFRVAFFNLPQEVEAELKSDLAKCVMAKDRLDFVTIFVKAASDFEKQFLRFSGKLAPAGMLWVSWPKKSSGVRTDLNENLIRDFGLHVGLVDVKVCAVTEIWSALKFVIRVKNRDKRPPT
jgi:hypothetical protein